MFTAMLLAMFCGLLLPNTSKAQAHNTFLIGNVRIFDGTHLIAGNSVLVSDGRIARVGIGVGWRNKYLDASGLFADLKEDFVSFMRYPVTTRDEQQCVLLE